MSLQDRIAALTAKHQALEAQIEEENRRPLPDEGIIIGLKRQKLRIKDELSTLSH
ncbi:MAG: YdcH family protein [Magnetospiraceae bacterium]